MNKPVIAQKGPFKVILEPGKKFWCSCGESKNQPYCDATHKEKGIFSPVKFEIEEKKVVFLCGCKNTKTPPFCDATHKEL